MSIAVSKPGQTKPASAEPSKRAVAPRPARARYDEDFARWAFEQAALLRDAGLNGLDIENIAEELESLGRQELNTLESALAVLLMHMLKWDHQPNRRSRSWANTIIIQRLQIEKQIKDNPSLKPQREAAVVAAYKRARPKASTETTLPLSRFPLACPYHWDELTARPFYFDADEASE